MLSISTATSRPIAVFVVAFLAPVATCGGEPGDAILGRWFNADQGVQIEIGARKNEEGQKRYYGTLVWLREAYYDGPGEEYGDPLRDAKNPDPERQNDPILGLEILKEFEYSRRKNRWNGGRVYDPESGKTYRAVMSLSTDRKAEGGVRLKLRGYVLVRLIGRSSSWTRVPKDWEAPDPMRLPPRTKSPPRKTEPRPKTR